MVTLRALVLVRFDPAREIKDTLYGGGSPKQFVCQSGGFDGHSPKQFVCQPSCKVTLICGGTVSRTANNHFGSAINHFTSMAKPWRTESVAAQWPNQA